MDDSDSTTMEEWEVLKRIPKHADMLTVMVYSDNPHKPKSSCYEAKNSDEIDNAISRLAHLSLSHDIMDVRVVFDKDAYPYLTLLLMAVPSKDGTSNITADVVGKVQAAMLESAR